MKTLLVVKVATVSESFAMFLAMGHVKGDFRRKTAVQSLGSERSLQLQGRKQLYSNCFLECWVGELTSRILELPRHLDGLACSVSVQACHGTGELGFE